MGLFEYNPPAILKSLKTANQLGKVKVVGFDENDATLQAIKDGTMHGTVVHNPYQLGYKSIEVLNALKQGKDHIIPKDGFIKIPARAIRRDNVEQFQVTLKKHLKGPDPMAVSDDWPRFSIVNTGHAGFWTIASTGTSEAGYDLRVQTEIHKPTRIKDQNRILQELVAEGVDGIAISPLDPANQKAFLQDIAKKTILITNDIDAPESNRRAHISLDNYEAGRLCGKLVKEALPQGGEVMIFVGLLNSETAKLRQQGLIDELNNVEAPSEPHLSGSGDDDDTNATTNQYAWIKGGEFNMGLERGPKDEQPVHKVRLDSFWIGKHEVTNAEFESFTKDTGYLTIAERKPKRNFQKFLLLHSRILRRLHCFAAEEDINEMLSKHNAFLKWWNVCPNKLAFTGWPGKIGYKDKLDHPVVHFVVRRGSLL